MTGQEKSKSISDEEKLAELRGEEYKPAKRNEALLINRILSNRTDEENIALAAATAKGHNPKEYKLKQKLKSYNKKKERDGFFEELQKL